MSTGGNQSTWLSERTAVAVLAALSISLAALIVLPYLKYVLLAAVLAYVLMPLQRRLERRVPSMAAALALVALAVLAIILPVAFVLAVAIQEAIELLAIVAEGDVTVDAIETRLAAAGYPMDLESLYATYQEPIQTGLQGIATSALEIVGGLLELFIGLTVMVFVLFSLLYEGDRLLAWSRRVVPLEDDVQQPIFAELDRLMWASVVGNVAVALVQAVLLATGLTLLGVPGVALLAVTAFVFALLPLIGVIAVWLPVSLYLAAAGRPVAAALLVGYGTIVSVTDNYLRAAVIGHSGELSVATVVVGIFGGVAVFGLVGLFIGPVVLGGAKVVLETIARERPRAARAAE